MPDSPTPDAKGAQPRPEGWPEKCANCGEDDWRQIGWNPVEGFNCRTCGGCDSDE